MPSADTGRVREGTHFPPAFRLGHRRWLDGLRGIAILLVLAVHTGLLTGGWLGVDLFFVLSGFLITTLLVEEQQRSGKIHFGRFYLRRFLRLVPALLVVCALCYAGKWLLSPEEIPHFRKELLVALCYISNWPTIHQVGMPTLGFTWSLSIEEQFYLLWPMLLAGLWVMGAGRRGILLVVGAGAAGAMVLRTWLYFHLPTQEPARQWGLMRLYTGLDTRADALLIGCLVGLLASWNLLPRSLRARRWTRGIAQACVGVLAYTSATFHCWHPFCYCGLMAVVSLAAGGLLFGMLVAPSPDLRRVLEWTPLVGLGRISYGLYLFHHPVIHFLRLEKLGLEAPGNTLVALGLSLGLALLSFYLVERPCLRLKDRIGRATKPPVSREPLRVTKAA